MLPLVSADAINDWCSAKTKGLIKQILFEIPERAVLYIINAVYFKGKWSFPFDVESTRKMKFKGIKEKVCSKLISSSNLVTATN